MKASKFCFLITIICNLWSCSKDTIETSSALQNFEQTKYYDSEIFTQPYLKIYGIWKIYNISGGFGGAGYKLDFDYLEFKEYGIYGFVINDSLLEYGKIAFAVPAPNEIKLRVNFEQDEKSDYFFEDKEKYIEFSGNDTLHLNSPCCDRYGYHFKRIK